MTWMPEEGVLKGKCPPRKKMTFANSFYVPPNRLDFHSAFLKFSPQSQAAVLATLTIICILYVLAVMWARHVDKEDLLKVNIMMILLLLIIITMLIVTTTITIILITT